VSATITERVAADAQAAEAGCEAIMRLLGIDLGRCGSGPTSPYLGTCEHEHVKKRLLCERHASHPEAGLCRDCFGLPEPYAHECPIVLTPTDGA
jgi:hypothetical protein